jgi:hypothetical protein
MRYQRLVRLVITAVVASLGSTALHAQPFPITELVVEGDLVTGVGLVTRIDAVAVNVHGDWLVEADTNNADPDTDTVLLRNGSLYLRENDPVERPNGATINSFDSINLNANLDSGWNFFLSGPPTGQDSGIYFNTTLVIQEGDTSIAPEFGAGTTYLGFFDVKINDANQHSIVASVDDPTVAGTLERAVVRMTVNNGGMLVSESKLAIEGDVLPGQVQAIVDFGTGPHQSAINGEGRILFFADLAGSTLTDGVLYLDDELVAQEGDPSPVAGRNYELLSSRGNALNKPGEVAFKANLSGDTLDDEALIVEGQAVVREGQSLPGMGGFTLTGFGTGSGPLQLDDNRNLLWFGVWNDPNTDIDSGLYLNDLLLVQEGVTMIGGALVDTIASGADAFAISDDGGYIIFEADLVGGVNGAFLIEIDAPQPVPDGKVVAGSPMIAAKNLNGTDIDVSWDVASCPADDYNLFLGDLASVSSYAYTGASCAVGAGGQTTFTPLANSTFWIIAGVDGDDREGSHGFNSEGRTRAADAGGLCGVTTQLRSSVCP